MPDRSLACPAHCFKRRIMVDYCRGEIQKFSLSGKAIQPDKLVEDNYIRSSIHRRVKEGMVCRRYPTELVNKPFPAPDRCMKGSRILTDFKISQQASHRIFEIPNVPVPVRTRSTPGRQLDAQISIGLLGADQF